VPSRLASTMNRDTFLPTAEGEIRLLLLIDAFSGHREGLQGRTRLAKLDFLLRYPSFLRRALEKRGDPLDDQVLAPAQSNCAWSGIAMARGIRATSPSLARS
jgi:hypothetical protein